MLERTVRPMKRLHLLALPLLLALGCERSTASQVESLTLDPLPGLPKYDGGRILHPWHNSKPDHERFAQVPIVASASDADCLLGDERFDKCLVFDCETNPCPTGKCWDVTVMHDPDGSPPPSVDWHGIPIVSLPNGLYYQPLHQAVCLK